MAYRVRMDRMKTFPRIAGGLAWVGAGLGLGLVGFGRLMSGDPPLEGRFREIRGEVRFDNANPEITGWLGAPENQGMQSLSVRASAQGGDEGLVSIVGVPTPGRLANPYRMSVQAGTNAATAVAYSVQAVSGLGADEALYYFAPREIGPLQAVEEPLVLDLAECVGGLRLRFVDANGGPVVISGGQGFVTVGGEIRVQVLGLRGGTAEVFLPVPAGVELAIGLQFRTGNDPYRDEIQFPVNVTTNVTCDSVLTIPVVVGAPGALGRIAGPVDLEGEFEWATGPAAFGGLLGRTALVGTGPAGNRRFDLLPGDNAAVAASGFAELENLVASDAVQPPEPWRVQAQMHFRSGRRFEHFISPALGEGLNPGLVVSGGGTTDLGDRFRMRRSVVVGTLEFAGPPDTAAAKSTLRGILRPDDSGVDEHGIPVNAAGYGITDSHLVANGQDVVVSGAEYTAAGGRAAVNFEGEYQVDRGAFVGDFEAVVGGLGGGPSVWKRDELHLSIATAGQPDVAEVNEVLTITDRAAAAVVAVPGEDVRSDLRLGFSEVCLRFRTPGRRFHSPAVSQARGEWIGPDAWGQAQDYAVNIEAAYGLPTSSATAGAEGVLNLTLPQGVYRLRPSINVLNEDGNETVTQLDEIEVTVPARQRVCVEGCLQVSVTAPACPTDGVVNVTGVVKTCGQAVTSVTYQVDDGPHVVVCAGCGVDPALSIAVPVGPGLHTLTISAQDAAGAVSSATLAIGQDTTPPVIVCPARRVMTAEGPCGWSGAFGVEANDACGPVTVSYAPAEGSMLPMGDTLVTATATDASGNVATCQFVVTVVGPGTDPRGLLGYEPFAYGEAAEAPALTGLAGGLGWAGPWMSGGFNADPMNGERFRLSTDAPNPGLLPQTGGAARVAALPLGLGGILRKFAEPVGTEGTVLFASVVLRPEGTVGDGAFQGFFGMTLNGTTGDDLFVGKPGGGDVGRYVVETRGGVGQVATAKDVVAGQAVRLVVRAEFRAGNDRFVLYVDPPADGPEPATGAVKEDLDLGLVTAVGLYATGAYSADEIRVGRTYAEVVATLPLPPTLGAVFPDRVSPAGGTTVVVTGSGLHPTDEILVGGQLLEAQVWVSPTEVSGVVPALAAGAHAIQVRRCGAVAATLEGAVTSAAQPVLMAIEPTSGFAAGGGLIQAAGTGFTESTRIRIAVGGGPDVGLVQGLSLSPGGGLLSGTIPPLPPEAALGTYDVVAEDPAGNAVLVGAFTYLPNATPAEDVLVEALRQLQVESTAPLQLSLRQGIPDAIGGRFPVTGGTPEARALGFVETHRAVFQLPETGALELGVASVAREEGDHVRLKQSIGGVPVFGGELVVSLSGDEVVAVNGGLLPPGELGRAGVSLVPQLTGADARVVAVRALGIPAPGFGVVAETELMVFDLALFDDRALDPHLVHRVTLHALDRELFVDAHSGEVLLNRALSQSDGPPLDGLELYVRDTRGATNLMTRECELAGGGTLLVARSEVDGDDDDSFINPQYVDDTLALAVYRYSRDAYAFFHTRFDWHGFLNSDYRVMVFVHDPVANNAFAHGCFIRIGDQQVDYEVVVHEYAHNITSAPGNSGLVYLFQSGALNESYSDIMGVSAGRLAGQTDWRYGPGGFSRDFIDPTRSGLGNSPQPAHFANFVTVRPDTNGVLADAGGVHMNSGIPNRAAYLLSEGLSLPNGGAPPRFHPGIGLDRMMQLKFASMRLLPANASFAAARNFEVQYATTLSRLPFTGFGAAEVAAVRNSWFLVGVGNPDINGDGIEETIDSDGDFVPDAIDNCRWKPNTRQEDSDADGIGDVCDNCPKHYNRRQTDLDRDDIGDECDDDMDGDGCRNGVDQEPRETLARIGRTVASGLAANCDAEEGDYYGPVSQDTDRDGRLDCQDDDDDGDGIPDAADPCPVGKLSDFFGRNFLPFPYLPLVGECGVQSICNPRLPPAVLDYGNFDYERVIVRVRDAKVNPSPERDVILDDVRIVNGTVYAFAGSGAPLGGLANRILGVSGSGGRRDGGPAGPGDGERRRVELWTRATETSPAQLIGVIGELDPATVSLDDVGEGRWLALRVGVDGAPAQLASTWQFGGGEATSALDSDRDGLPDGYEVGVGLDPNAAADALSDGDGDGLDALTEYRAGTDPRSAQSRFGLLGISPVNGGFRIEWMAASGRTVILERAATPDAGAWRAVGAPVRMQGDRAGMDVPGDGASEGYFRVRIP